MGEKKKILLIDDETDFTGLVKANLEETKEYEVIIENIASKSVSAAKKHKPDLILLDIIMPDMAGSEVASRLKNDDTTRDIPIVFLTAITTKEEAKERNSVIGGYPFVAKPASTQELIDCIEKNIK